MCPGVLPSAGSLTLLSELKSTHIIRLPCSFKWKKNSFFSFPLGKQMCAVAAKERWPGSCFTFSTWFFKHISSPSSLWFCSYVIEFNLILFWFLFCTHDYIAWVRISMWYFWYHFLSHFSSGHNIFLSNSVFSVICIILYHHLMWYSYLESDLNNSATQKGSRRHFMCNQPCACLQF